MMNSWWNILIFSVYFLLSLNLSSIGTLLLVKWEENKIFGKTKNKKINLVLAFLFLFISLPITLVCYWTILKLLFDINKKQKQDIVEQEITNESKAVLIRLKEGIKKWSKRELIFSGLCLTVASIAIPTVVVSRQKKIKRGKINKEHFEKLLNAINNKFPNEFSKSGFVTIDLSYETLKKENFNSESEKVKEYVSSCVHKKMLSLATKTFKNKEDQDFFVSFFSKDNLFYLNLPKKKLSTPSMINMANFGKDFGLSNVVNEDFLLKCS